MASQKQKQMRKLIANLNKIINDVRLYPKGRLLVSLLHAAFSQGTPEEDRRLIKALIVAEFIRKGSVTFSDDIGLMKGGLAQKPPKTNLEEAAADSIDEMLQDMLRGEHGQHTNTNGRTGSNNVSSDSDSASSAE